LAKAVAKVPGSGVTAAVQAADKTAKAGFIAKVLPLVEEIREGNSGKDVVKPPM
jgi:hypothetical protein